MRLPTTLLSWMLLAQGAVGFDYTLDVDSDTSLSITDTETGIGPIVTMFNDEYHAVHVSGVGWEALDDDSGADIVFWTTSVNGEVQATGNLSLADAGRELPSGGDAGEVKVSKNGRNEIIVEWVLGDSVLTFSNEYESYGSAVSIIPLLMVLLLAATTRMVELSLFTAIFLGSCIVQGSLKDGFLLLLDDYILNALADIDHGYVYLFTLFLSGLVGMMEKSGGMAGFTRDVQDYAKTPRTGQFACFGVGVFVFFDDYANVLLAGETMRPLLDMLCVSREKLAFIVDATAAPIASISPISSWVGYEVGLIQDEIDRISDLVGAENLTIKDSGLAVFFQSIKYRYYPIFMIVLMVALIATQRDFGTMLVAERKTEVYRITDGGPGKGLNESSGVEDHNKPKPDTPKRSWNMIIPVFIMVFFIFFLLVRTGKVDGESQSLMDKIENSNSYTALLWGTMAASIVTGIFYLLQIKQNGDLLIPNGDVLKLLFSSQDDDKPRFLMGVGESVEAFLYGMGRIFPALIVLTLAWASGSVMKDVGADRLFSRWIVGGISPEALPTLSFIISFFMALATGTSWGTMSILFPLILVPTYQASNGDEIIFYATTAGVLSGSVAGDHVSPISDTTVLSSLACDCKLLSHVITQAPYVVITVLVSIVLGTVPIGYSDMPNIVGILLGAGVIIAFVFGICVPVLSPTGRYDIFIELMLMVRGESELLQLKQDTIAYVAGGVPPQLQELPPNTLGESVAVEKKFVDVEDELLGGDEADV